MDLHIFIIGFSLTRRLSVHWESTWRIKYRRYIPTQISIRIFLSFGSHYIITKLYMYVFFISFSRIVVRYKFQYSMLCKIHWTYWNNVSLFIHIVICKIKFVSLKVRYKLHPFHYFFFAENCLIIFSHTQKVVQYHKLPFFSFS